MGVVRLYLSSIFAFDRIVPKFQKIDTFSIFLELHVKKQTSYGPTNLISEKVVPCKLYFFVKTKFFLPLKNFCLCVPIRFGRKREKDMSYFLIKKPCLQNLYIEKRSIMIFSGFWYTKNNYVLVIMKKNTSLVMR